MRQKRLGFFGVILAATATVVLAQQIGDVDGNGYVDDFDLLLLQSNWHQGTPRPTPTSTDTPAAASPTPTSTPELPTPSPTSTPSGMRLENVQRWLYFLDVNLAPAIVDQIVSSTHDMVVIDYIPSEQNNTDYPIANVVNRMRTAAHPRLVIAYIDIGQAEDYRTYWQPGWGIGDPNWIVALDPDGWEGNYPVLYWHQDYQAIWLGAQTKEGYLQGILDAGFDGVYLDWIEAYSDENVLASATGVDATQEMVSWVGKIAQFCRTQDPDFIVIAQNAAELAARDDYLGIIDAISQEQVWFDGGADNNPPGDCPLPRTEEDIDTPGYEMLLQNEAPAGCYQLYINYPDSTLHVSSESYLNQLMLAQLKGELIFTVDYALIPANVDWIYQTSRGMGFIPFVGGRALDQYVPPHE